MSKKGQSKNDLKNLTYIAQKPSFLQNFGQPKPPSPPPGRSGVTRDGREPLPERPRDGTWAGGSDDEGGKGGEESDDEWGDVYGGGGDEGPQVVVLKEGRHLTADDVKRERRRAAGKASASPPPPGKNPSAEDNETKTKTQIPPRIQSSAKRKLVGKDTDTEPAGPKDGGGKKKKKGDKKLLSFDQED